LLLGIWRDELVRNRAYDLMALIGPGEGLLLPRANNKIKAATKTGTFMNARVGL
jgi:hypothetical protein